MANEEPSVEDVTANDILEAAIEEGASDIHFKAGYAPYFDIGGELASLNMEPLDRTGVDRVVKSVMLSDNKIVEHNEKLDVDFGFTAKERRYRAHAGFDRNGPTLDIRLIPDGILPVESTGFPPGVWERIVHLKQGMVLVTGAAGHGKSTTISSLINKINEVRNVHIITIEDPVEAIQIPIDYSMVSQRQVGSTTTSFEYALRSALRQAPHVISVGEIRDRETARVALEAAYTGHLVFTTLHAPSTTQAVQRYVGMFEPSEEYGLRNDLASGLAYVVSQKLVKRADGKGRLLAMEVMNVVDSDSIQHKIRKGDDKLLISDLQTGKNLGMITMDDYLCQLYERGKITLDTALINANRPTDMKAKYQGKS